MICSGPQKGGLVGHAGNWAMRSGIDNIIGGFLHHVALHVSIESYYQDEMDRMAKCSDDTPQFPLAPQANA
jgi:hypothetical protein